MASYEASAVSRGDPEAVWSAWTAVASWSASDHIESASIDGEFRAGAVVRSKARGFPASTLTVTRVDRPTLWVDESRSPGMRMTFDHIIAPTADGTSVTERVEITGPLGFAVGLLLRRKLQALLAASVAHVADTAASTNHSGPEAG